jgi:hypothetical protein
MNSRVSFTLLLVIIKVFSVVADEIPTQLTHFKISNDMAEYFHRPATTDYHVIIRERLNLYQFLFEVSRVIQSENLNDFKEIMSSSNRNSGFCFRFHVVVMIINRYIHYSTEHLSDLIVSLSEIDPRDTPDELVRSQFSSFYSSITDQIEQFSIESERHAAIIEALRRFLESESRRIFF